MEQPYPTLEEFNYIGKPGLRRLDGLEKVSGEAVYTKDVILPGMLYGKYLVSPYSHARIKSIDTSKAEAYPGVHAVVRWDDPELQADFHPDGKGCAWASMSIKYGDFKYRDWQFTVGREAINDGDHLGCMLAAESEQICDEALKLVEVEWEELPFVLDMKESIAPGAPIAQLYRQQDINIRSDTLTEYGDIEAGFKEADKVIEFSVKKGENNATSVEPYVVLASWRGDYLDIWTKGQHGHVIQWQTAVLVPYPMNKIRVAQPFSGAGFGGVSNTSLSNIMAHAAALLSKRARRPVRLSYEGGHWVILGEEFGYWDIKVGAKNDGTITAVDVETLNGFSAGISKMRQSTKIKNMREHNQLAWVNRGICHCWRHGVNSTVTQNMVFEHIAAELGMDPTEVALKNSGTEGEDWDWVTEYQIENGFPQRHSLKECLDAGKAAIDWDNKWHAPGTKKLPNGKMHGLGVAWSTEWTHTPGGTYDGNRLGMLIRRDGTLCILGRLSDIGVCEPTAGSMVAADEVGMKFEDVDWRHHDDVGADALSPAGASSTTGNMLAIVRASREAKQQLLEMATKPVPGSFIAPPRDPYFPDKTPEELDVKESVIFEKANPSNKHTVAEVVDMFSKDPVMGWGSQSWNPPDKPAKRLLMIRQAHFAEVEVDTETGAIEVTKAVIVNDVGKVLNPDSAHGQQYGGASQGMGRAIIEELFHDPQTGVRLNDNFVDYQFYTMNDMKSIECILVETGGAYGVYGMAGIGEDVGAATVEVPACALYNAIGVWVNDYPLTPERVLKALGKA